MAVDCTHIEPLINFIGSGGLPVHLQLTLNGLDLKYGAQHGSVSSFGALGGTLGQGRGTKSQHGPRNGKISVNLMPFPTGVHCTPQERIATQRVDILVHQIQEETVEMVLALRERVQQRTGRACASASVAVSWRNGCGSGVGSERHSCPGKGWGQHGRPRVRFRWFFPSNISVCKFSPMGREIRTTFLKGCSSRFQ